jgi:hypothetical protein
MQRPGISRKAARSAFLGMVCAAALSTNGAWADDVPAERNLPKGRGSGLIGGGVDIGLNPLSVAFDFLMGFSTHHLLGVAAVGLGGDVRGSGGILLARAEIGARLFEERSSPFVLVGLEARLTGCLGCDPSLYRTDTFACGTLGYMIAFRPLDLWIGLALRHTLSNGQDNAGFRVPPLSLTAKVSLPF